MYAKGNYTTPALRCQWSQPSCTTAAFATSKVSTDDEQDFHINFVASVLDGRQVALAEADPISKISLRNVGPPAP